MSGTVCLQGGAEFAPGYREMDAALIAGETGPVVVTALAGAPGREYDTANRNGVAHYRAVGATDVRAAPDVREDPEGALATLRAARVVVLPGGSPSRLLTALTSTPLAGVLAELLATGGTLIGSSAGAMVLGAWTVLPERPGPSVARGLGLAAGVLVVPHWSGARADWLQAVEAAVPPDVLVLGLPEQAGVVLRARTVTAAGRAPTRLIRQDRDLEVGRSVSAPEAQR